MKILGVIPARLESTRLGRKLLRDLAGKLLIQHVYENAIEAESLDEVVVACDDLELVEAVKSFSANAVLTSKKHESGTQRIQEVAGKISADIYVNIQGDEPLMPAENIDLLIRSFTDRKEFLVGTLAIRKEDPEEFVNKNVVKVVCDASGKALYFSRSPIPCHRDPGEVRYWKHLGIYAYRAEFWKRYSGMKSSWLEHLEKLEQLKFLENGISIQVIETHCDSVGVDTEEDLELVRRMLLDAARK